VKKTIKETKEDRFQNKVDEAKSLIGEKVLFAPTQYTTRLSGKVEDIEVKETGTGREKKSIIMYRVKWENHHQSMLAYPRAITIRPKSEWSEIIKSRFRRFSSV